jgi:hypothetical protein
MFSSEALHDRGEELMTDPLSRRRFLTRASLGAAAAAAATVAATSGIATVEGLLASAPAVNGGEPEPDVTPVGQDVVAHVRNASTGEVSIMVGEHEVAYTDRALVARLLKGARQAGRGA